jgi:hypothetical protein
MSARRRLEAAVDSSCDRGEAWAARVAAGVRAALQLVEAEPESGRALAAQAANRGGGWEPEFAALVEALAARFERDAPPVARPERTARNTVLLLVRQVLLYLETRPAGRVTEIAPDLIVFSITPYVGLEEARRRAM